MIKRIFIAVFLRVPATILLLVAIVLVVNSMFAPVYKFAEPTPFTGESIYNPYSDWDSSIVAKKANFHAHSRLAKGMTNGALGIEEVVDKYKSFGYDVVGISNYQTISKHDGRPEYEIPVYEHGYNLQKFHCLVFGENSRTFYDPAFPVTPSACQYKLNHLIKRSDAICLNHPRFTLMFPVSRMKYLYGYRFIEADAGMSSAFAWWDMALSSGIPSFILSGDDSHNVARSHDIATHCTFIGSQSTKYVDIITTLKAGRSYSMRIPNFGNGDWDVKYAENRTLPTIKNIGMREDSLHISLSRAADSIKFIGQNGVTQTLALNATDAKHHFSANDTYVRAEVIFDNGVKIYTNPTFRYRGDDPFAHTPASVNVLLTLLLTLFKLVLLSVFIFLSYRVLRPLFCCK